MLCRGECVCCVEGVCMLCRGEYMLCRGECVCCVEGSVYMYVV